MASASPVLPESDGDNEADAAREEDSEPGTGDPANDTGDAVAEGEIVGGLVEPEEGTSTEERNAVGEDGDAVETTRFFGDELERSSELELLAKGDSLPISWRSDNGTRESEFYEPGEKETLNPYYDVVRRLSPTELIGRFMRTSSPRVRGFLVAVMSWLFSACVKCRDLPVLCNQ